MKPDCCIYCNKSNDFSEEHPLPFALGEFEGLPTLNDRICRDCNSKIGGIEEQFLRSGPEAFFRKYLGISGRKQHEPKNIFIKGSSGAPPIDFMAELPENKKIRILHQLGAKKGTIQELRQIVFIGNDGNNKTIRISDYMLNSYENFEAGVKKSNIDLSQYKNAHLVCPPHEMARMQELLKSWGEFEWLDIPESSVIDNSKLTFTVTDNYFRALVKIGFHLLLAVDDEYIGNEEYFRSIKDYIYNGYGKIAVSESDAPILPFENLIPNSWSHLLLIDVGTNYIKIRLQFFFSPECKPPIYEFTLVNSQKQSFKRFYQVYQCCYSENEEGIWEPEKAIIACEGVFINNSSIK